MRDLFNYIRRKSREVKIGDLLLGGNNPVRVQTMANTDTNDIEGSINQYVKVVEVGSELMRYTTQGIREVKSLQQIHTNLRNKGYKIPLVADIHFNSNAAMLAAQVVEKVRINPGNFITGIKKKSDISDYTEEEFELEYDLLKKRFTEFLEVCKKHHTTIRIGVNHGSLSQRIMNRYGDTAHGMVESCMELLRICVANEFYDVVISMKTSNTVFMVHAVRLLVKEMEREGFDFPLHLGVTEAGEGEDGRIKSAVGIGALLADGIGDTIRVSLSEDPEFEIPVAKTLVSYINERAAHPLIIAEEYLNYNSYQYERRRTHAVKNIGADNYPVVIASSSGNINYSILPDYFIQDGRIIDNSGNSYPVYTCYDIDSIKKDSSELIFLRISYPDLKPEILSVLNEQTNIVILLETNHTNGVGEQRAFFHTLLQAEYTTPVIICRKYQESSLSDLQIKASADVGVMFIDGFGDGVLIENTGNIAPDMINSVSFGILQAARVRITRTEYISCPGCGRTLFDLQQSVALVKENISHLKGLKIAVMGCIVNGPGEMADADYGYVGAGRGKVNLYKNKECIESNIPEDKAIDKLIELIKKHNKST